MVAKRSIPSRLIETLFVGVALEDFELPDEGLLAKAREELGIGGDELVISTIGRLDGEKGHAFLLEAAQMVLKEGVSARFLIIGDGPHDAKLKAQAKDLGIEK
jgi:glycosyltransferase involved in cell wall biosynthesis